MPAAPAELWRISDFFELNGAGGLYYAARWNTVGRRIVYLAETPPGALLELLVHLELKDFELPQPYNLLRIGVPEDQQTEDLAVPEGGAWKKNLETTRTIGDAWLKSRSCASARVPSAIMPFTYNYLLNPEHPGAALFTVKEVNSAEFDPRLLRKVNP